jgi:gluconokinase
MAETRVVLVMGAAGAGKTTLGAALAGRLGVAFLDADDLHPPANRAKMAAGVALDDADRGPWLESVAGVIAAWAAAGAGGVVACSALKRRYRERLRAAAGGGLALVWLDVDAASLARRLAARRGHYFPPGLLDSQLAALEPPGPDEGAIRVSGALGVDEAVDAVLMGG